MTPPPVSLEEHHAIEQFLYREARLLDERRYTDWLALLADDCTYRVPVRENRAVSRDAPHMPVDDELCELLFLEEDKLTLLARVLRLGTGTAWGENPPSRVRHFVTNVESERADAPDTYRVYSNVFVHRTRRADQTDRFVGQRRDLIRRGDKGLLLAERVVVLDTAVLEASNLGVFL